MLQLLLQHHRQWLHLRLQLSSVWTVIHSGQPFIRLADKQAVALSNVKGSLVLLFYQSNKLEMFAPSSTLKWQYWQKKTQKLKTLSSKVLFLDFTQTLWNCSLHGFPLRMPQIHIQEIDRTHDSQLVACRCHLAKWLACYWTRRSKLKYMLSLGPLNSFSSKLFSF